MASPAALLVLGAIGAIFWLILRRATELFCVRVERGSPRHVRGRMPPALFSDFCDILASPRIDGAVVRAVTEGGRPRLIVDGDLHPDQVQRLRNVLGRFQTAQIRSGRRAR
jgi:hypothetical protein